MRRRKFSFAPPLTPNDIYVPREDPRLIVRASHDSGDMVFGPFSNRAAAEQCVIALAGKSGIKSVEIEETRDA